jgi:HK97 gp10 family phage protein
MATIGGVKIDWYDKAVTRKIKDKLHAVSREVANDVAKDARTKCPWDTGDLATSITIKKSKYPDGGFYVQAHGPEHEGHDYAKHVELGTHKEHKQKAQPFMRPARKKNIPKARKKWQAALDKL